LVERGNFLGFMAAAAAAVAAAAAALGNKYSEK